ncbi:MAG: hypothetical protein GY851_32215, partial [bacterium]|nr:hypothetical protein [bacterium]
GTGGSAASTCHSPATRFGRTGGIESLIKALASNIPDLQTSCRVVRVRRAGTQWEVSDGNRTLQCDRLISTVPVFDLITALEDVPDDVRDAVRGLQYNSLIVVMVAINHAGLTEKTGIYLPDPKILPHRVCYMCSFSSANAPADHSHLIAEITQPPGHAMLDAPDDVLIEKVINGVRETCGFHPGEVVAAEVQRVPYAYPVYDRDYLRNTQVLYTYLDDIGIHFTGRFAAFRYVNMDVCVEMARELAAALNAGTRPRREWRHL